MGIKSMNDIILYGAFDRHNYGDLLFPLVMERMLSQKFPNKKVVVAGLIDSDLSEFYALKTDSIKKAMRESRKDVSIILAGGDVVACDWLSAYSYLLSDFSFSIFQRIFARYIPKATEGVIKKIIGLKSEGPFDLTAKDLTEDMKLIYNSVGATGVSSIEGESAITLANTLNNADYVTVRDEFSREHIERIGSNVSDVYPDSATVMSSVFSNDEINKKTSSIVESLITELKGNYLVFQISSAHCAGLEAEFAQNLTAIANEHDLTIVFIAIGNAAGHSDSQGIERIKQHLDNNIKVKQYLSGGVFDLMNIIKNSQCYCGTSLHGLITSMAFHIPRVGLLPKLRKQRNYMATWDLPTMPSGILPGELSKAVSQAMAVPKLALKEKEEFLTKRYLENFDKICQLIR
jgi:polysaccharide pyruvyl transferase WcaK-like protein